MTDIEKKYQNLNTWETIWMLFGLICGVIYIIKLCGVIEKNSLLADIGNIGTGLLLIFGFYMHLVKKAPSE